MQGILTSETRCLNCETVTSKDEEFCDLSIDVDQNTSVTSCLRCQIIKSSNYQIFVMTIIILTIKAISTIIIILSIDVDTSRSSLIIIFLQLLAFIILKLLRS